MVYFIQPGDIQKVKIGFCASSLSLRLRSLQTGSCEILKIIGVLPDAARTVEQDLHQRFEKDWLHGEWFTFSGAIRGFISANAKFPAFNPDEKVIGFYDSEAYARRAERHLIELLSAKLKAKSLLGAF